MVLVFGERIAASPVVHEMGGAVALCDHVLCLPIVLCSGLHMGMLSHFGCVQLFVSQGTVACQASLSVRFSR